MSKKRKKGVKRIISIEMITVEKTNVILEQYLRYYSIMSMHTYLYTYTQKKWTIKFLHKFLIFSNSNNSVKNHHNKMFKKL